MGRLFVVTGGLLGFLAVALGAYFEHGLKGQLDPASFNSLQIALRHQQLHSVVILILGFSLFAGLSLRMRSWLKWAAAAMLLGVIVFSGSIYLTYVLHLSELRRLAPTGGILTMLGWLLVVFAAADGSRKQEPVSE